MIKTIHPLAGALALLDTGFYVAQALELAAGATNIALLSLNMRDGLKMKGRLRRKPAQSIEGHGEPGQDRP